MAATEKNLKQFQNRLILIAALWLCFSPFTLGFIGNANASVSAFLIASIILLISQLGDFDRPHAVEWLNISASIILIVSPWLLNYSDVLIALINAEFCGVTILLFSYLSFQQDVKITKSSSHLN